MGRRVYIIVVYRVGMWATSLGLVIASIYTSLVLSLPLLVIGGGLVRDILLRINLSHRNRRSRGWI